MRTRRTPDIGGQHAVESPRRSGGRTGAVATALWLTIAVCPLPAAADELNLAGTWQVNSSCGTGITQVRTVDVTEDLMTGAFTLSTTNCGTLFFENAIHVLASCTPSWNGVVSGSSIFLPPAGVITDDVQFETPFPSSFLGCTTPPCARYVVDIVETGSIVDDGMGNAVQVNGSITFHHVQVYNTDTTLTFDGGGPGGCVFTMLRNEIPAGSDVTVVPYDGTSLTFSDVITPGVVQLTPLTVPSAAVPANFQLFDLPIYYDVTTTAVFAGTVAVCVPYPDANDDGQVDGTTPPIDETTLRILHEEQDVFVDRTASLDTVGNTICAEVSSFSQFALGRVDGAATCGNGTLELGELCDDGNTLAGDCCSELCQFESAGSSCSDGDLCTDDQCDGAGECVGAQASGCLTAAKSILLLKNAGDDAKDKLLWKWNGGPEITQAMLADPTASDSYALCVYAGAAGPPLVSATVPAGAGWAAVGTTGYKFKGASPNGLSLALLKGGSTGKSKALAKGKGATLPDPILPLAFPVTVQLRKGGSPLCLESTFTSTDAVKNESGQFKAKR